MTSPNSVTPADSPPLVSDVDTGSADDNLPGSKGANGATVVAYVVGGALLVGLITLVSTWRSGACNDLRRSLQPPAIASDTESEPAAATVTQQHVARAPSSATSAAHLPQ